MRSTITAALVILSGLLPAALGLEDPTKPCTKVCNCCEGKDDKGNPYVGYCHTVYANLHCWPADATKHDTWPRNSPSNEGAPCGYPCVPSA
ncbi:unnamed protein product [Zymoseptoria tritici ST99CH_1A5]|uniref:CBM1 domain-containing protein n=1 Tax=Zymoseptoria tritici ST99CH_1A5 TaxID=1276529 RepID=A0A1Y6LPB4_ZYMTR|nr:unnamed protein product [Zymoseptoria tritici ST99CH_3D1]SMY24451.1 unnamed protein product [Zymoseptoria tritici ST99CH_1A5]